MGRDVELGNVLHADPSPPGGLALGREGRLQRPLLLWRKGGVRLRELGRLDVHRACYLQKQQIEVYSKP